MSGSKVRVVKHTEPCRIHGFPENALILSAVKEPDGKKPGEVDGIGLRPVAQFFPGSSPAGAASVSPEASGGITARKSIPTTSSSLAVLKGTILAIWRGV